MSDDELLEHAASAIGQDTDGWNPLEDDATAFQLSAKLNLAQKVSPTVAEARKGAIYARESYSEDPCAAMRRAIVRVAASLAG